VLQEELLHRREYLLTNGVRAGGEVIGEVQRSRPGPKDPRDRVYGWRRIKRTNVPGVYVLEHRGEAPGDDWLTDTVYLGREELHRIAGEGRDDYVAACKQGAQDWRTLQETIYSAPGTHGLDVDDAAVVRYIGRVRWDEMKALEARDRIARGP